jgi:ATP-dependent Lon protease
MPVHSRIIDKKKRVIEPDSSSDSSSSSSSDDESDETEYTEYDSDETEEIVVPKKSKTSLYIKRPSLSESESDEDVPKRTVSKKKQPKRNKGHKKSSVESEKEDDIVSRESGKFNLILNVNDFVDEDEDEFVDEETDSLIEDVTEELDSEDEKTFMGEAYLKKDENPLENPCSSEPVLEEENVEEEYKELLDMRRLLSEQLKRRPENSVLLKSLKKCNKRLKHMVRKARHNNTNSFFKLLNIDKNKKNDVDYFKHRLSNNEQKMIMTNLKEVNQAMYTEKPDRLALLQANIPVKFKAIAMQRLNMLKTMTPGDNEYAKIKNWVDAFMRIPFNVHKNIDVKFSDGIDACNDFMVNARKTLDDCVYGLNDAKMQIMQMLGQWIVNPNSIGTSIAIHGPPGTGKTSIVKDGISKILGREFAFIALGGCSDGCYLEGHSYTYEGSTWGRILQILMECKSMNPVIYFDELDKVSEGPRGQEIIGILTHLTDTTQNSEFHDKYFSEISLDLSKCLFIFSYNEERLVNPVLKDRMYRIHTKGYETKDKVVIAKNYMLPKICEQVNFANTDIVIPEETIKYLVTTPHLTKNESGVRNLKRCFEIIYTKLNLYRLVKSGNEMLEKDLGVKVEFPFTVTRREVDLLIKNTETENLSYLSMFV